MSVESLKSFFDVASLVLLFATAVTGTGVLITGHIINKRQAVQLRQFDNDLTESKIKLGKQQERVRLASWFGPFRHFVLAHPRDVKGLGNIHPVVVAAVGMWESL